MKTLTTALLILVSLTSFGQTAEELNEQSKQLLQNREFDKVFPPAGARLHRVSQTRINSSHKIIKDDL